jgi:hypothetical protein
MEFAREYWYLILVAILAVAILAYILLRPRQRVQLSKDEAPVRPHMQHRRRWACPERPARAVSPTRPPQRSAMSADSSSMLRFMPIFPGRRDRPTI